MVHHAPHQPEPRARAEGRADLSAAETDRAGDDEAAALEAGRLLFARPCAFFHASQRLDQLPPERLPEIAFAGRSNVGKSSLINALTGRKALARASNTPGRTRQLNFFDLGARLAIVDMPGYGYAQAGHAIKRDWQGLMLDYLRGRPSLARVLLLDARVELKESDRTVMDLLDHAAVTFQIVLTKADGASPPRLAAKLAEAQGLARAHPAAYPEVVATSSETGAGIAELRASLAGLALSEEDPAP
jgi:GTP-binding protein